MNAIVIVDEKLNLAPESFIKDHKKLILKALETLPDPCWSDEQTALVLELEVCKEQETPVLDWYLFAENSLAGLDIDQIMLIQIEEMIFPDNKLVFAWRNRQLIDYEELEEDLKARLEVFG